MMMDYDIPYLSATRKQIIMASSRRRKKEEDEEIREFFFFFLKGLMCSTVTPLNLMLHPRLFIKSNKEGSGLSYQIPLYLFINYVPCHKINNSMDS